MSKVFQKANDAAKVVYEHFMQDVIEKYVINDRQTQRVYAKQENNKKSNETDISTLYLVSISGKGGWTNNPKKQASYLKNTNITLLDHLLSVTRGALMLATMDLLLLNEQMNSEDLQERLYVIAVIAFLHDLDKMEKIVRDEPIPLELVEKALKHYGLNDFLQGKAELSADQVRFLIEQAEESQAHRHRPVVSPHRNYQNDIKNYVKLADKLDGIWCEHGAEGGLNKLIERLKKEQSLHFDILSQWQVVELFDPHHPFLLDELQRYLSIECKRKSGIPPLIEVHQDGRLFMLLPTVEAEAIKQAALTRFCKGLPFSLYLNISMVGVPELINEQPNYEEYQQFISHLEYQNLSRIFTIKRYLVETITEPMDELLGDIGLKPQWPKSTGQTLSPYPDPETLKQQALTANFLNQSASLSLLLNLKTRANKKVPNYAQREDQLIAIVAEDVPEWISNIEEKARQSRSTLLALWATVLASKSEALQESIWGNDGLLKIWLEGNETQLGLRDMIENQGAQILGNIEQHFKRLMQGEYHSSVKGTGHCIFTDSPTNITIADKMKLHGVKVSAFAGRTGRPETVSSAPKGSVHISDISIAEYKLRSKAFKQQGGKSSGVPSLISSPVTTGLFSALVLTDEANFQALSIYDLARKKIQKGKVNYLGLEVYRRRYRMARFELMPVKLVDQINTLRLLLSSCLRIGRPIHVFRGLPVNQKAFFYYDAMPPVLYLLLGYKEFRIEQIPVAIQQLKIANDLINENGLGHDVFRRYANPKTRFKAACLAWCHLRDRESKSVVLKNQLLNDYIELVKENNMSEEDGALVKLGKSAAKLQRAPYGNVSTSEELLVFNLTLKAACGLRAVQQSDRASLINGIASDLETNLVRKDKMCSKQYRNGARLRDECIHFSTQFVDDVWSAVLKQRPPSQTTRRLLSSVYRMAFLQASRDKKNETSTTN
ncbi:MAG: HD domain-containing protein [Thiotrichaceae bacterium]|nr:HD domain-containing protein [Thiotrichaceae bacterium]